VCTRVREACRKQNHASGSRKAERMLTSSRLDCFLRVSATDGEMPDKLDIDDEGYLGAGGTGEGARSLWRALLADGECDDGTGIRDMNCVEKQLNNVDNSRCRCGFSFSPLSSTSLALPESVRLILLNLPRMQYSDFVHVWLQWQCNSILARLPLCSC
jgi:hypothetical protein